MRIPHACLLAVAGLALPACHPSLAPEAGPGGGVPPPPAVGDADLADYEAARHRTMEAGREIDHLIVERNASAIVARFGPDLARAVTEERLNGILGATVLRSSIGNRVDEGTLVPSASNRSYVADHRWADLVLSVSVRFDAAGAVTALLLGPRDPLPPDPRPGYKTKAVLRLPFRGTWWVFWGGRTERENYHVRALDQRGACDFVVWHGGATYAGEGIRNEDYGAWNQAVLAPADGVVVAAVNDVPDNRPRLETTNVNAPAGNHVVLDLGNDEYAVLSHLRQGSVRVRPGQAVKAGEMLAQCGNSGTTSEPHIHLHIQDRKELFGRALSLPMQFARMGVDGRLVPNATPRQGQFVRHPE
jgi:murein DD-endopeptidase MepM/ murein hydrolase activator NlpD